MNPLVQAGKLNRRVTIGIPTYTRNAQNERVEGDPDVKERWASMKPAPGTERFQDAETAAEVVMRFVFRWEPDLVTVEHYLQPADDARRYEVLSVSEIGLRDGWEVLAVARGEEA